MGLSVASNAIARYSLILLLFALPFFIIPVSWATPAQDKMFLCVVLLTIALISYCTGRFVAGSAVIPRHVILFAAILLPICYALSAFLSGAPIDSYVSGFGDQGTVFSTVQLCIALTLVAALFSGRGKHALAPLLALLSGGGIVIVFQLLRLVFPNALTLGGALSGSASSVVGGWHDLGVLTGFLLIASTTLLFEGGLSKWTRAGLLALSIGSCAMLIIVALPDIWFALAAIFFLLTVNAILDTHQRPRRSARMAAALPLAVTVLSLAVAFSTTFYFARLPGFLRVENTEVRPSWQTTWDIGTRIFSGDQALYGTGPDTFAEEWAKWKPLSVNASSFWNTDFTTGIGLIPTAFVTAGFLGAIAWLGVLLAILYQIFIVLRIAPERRRLYAALLSSVLFLAWFHIIDSPSFSITLVLFMLLGLIVALDTSDVRHTIHLAIGSGTPGRVGAAVLLVTVSGLGLYANYDTARALVSDVLVSKAAVEYGAGEGLANSLALIQSALVIYPSNAVAHRAAVAAGLVQWQDLLQKGNTANTAQLQTTLKKTIDEGLRAVSINSHDYQNWLSLAGLYQQLAHSGIPGAYQSALSAYKKASAVNPTNPLPLLNAGYVSLELGDATSAVSYLNAALGLKPDLAVGYYLRSQADVALNAYPDAIADAQQAIILAKSDPSGWYNLGAILYKQADYADAAVALSRATALQNDFANAYFLLSLSLEKIGQHGLAIEAMQKVVQLNPGNAAAEEALAALERTSPASVAHPAHKP